MRAWRFLEALALVHAVTALPRSAIRETERSPQGIVYELEEKSYFANSEHPRRVIRFSDRVDGDQFIPLTVIVANQTRVTGEYLETTIASYLASDDVISSDFLGTIYLSSLLPSRAKLDPSAAQYLKSHADRIFVDATAFRSVPSSFISTHHDSTASLPSGPYTAMLSKGQFSLLDTYRLYVDEYRDFITGMYPSNDALANFAPLQVMSSRLWGPMIPVPSRIYSWGDSRPLAGVRVSIKDLFDVQGMQTSAGSQAWIRITPVANTTAPAIQRLVDLGAILVGKYKLAQFASGANPWDWVDEHYPFNPRGDGYLTCSASSSGGGCAVAAYDWLDAAIGSDTGSSMRRPAAVSGTYGNRPSQGLISLEGAVALSWAQDTAGVFSRDPVAWSRFAKVWYASELHQGTEITGLSPLSVPDTTKFPSKVLYPDEYFPMNNSAAQEIVDSFVHKMTSLFDMTVEHFNFTSTVGNGSIYSNVTSQWEPLMMATGVLTYWPQYVDVFGPLLSTWKSLYNGRFPPVDPQWRSSWTQLNMSEVTEAAYKKSLQTKATAVDWFEKHVLYETPESCSGSLMLCDIGTGGVPSFREKDLNDAPNATYLAMLPEGAAVTCASICPLFGCVDLTIPLGQVAYESPVTMVTEQWPVSVNLIARRGCDFMLFNMIEKMAEAGIIGPVKTGREAF